MKRIYLLAIGAIMSISAAWAQEGNWLGGGLNIGFNSVINGESTVSFGIAPEFGHHFDNKLSVAGELGYNITRADNINRHHFYVGPYVRYDIFDNDNLTLFGELALHYQYVNVDSFGRNGVEVALRPGIAVKLSDRWSLTGKINLLEYGYLNEGDTHTLGFHLTTGLNVGFIYNL